MNKILFFLVVVFLGASIELKSQTIVINEFMADNAETISDPYGDYDDWIEVFNFGNEPVDIGGLYITDDFAEPTKYQIPQGNDSTIIQPQGFLLLWADEDLEQGVLHLDIKLSKTGEEIAFYKPDGATLIDSVSFGQQTTDVSFGRLPNGSSNWTFFDDPTPGSTNVTNGIWVSDNDSFTICPNPCRKTTTIHLPFSGEKKIMVFDLEGNLFLEQRITETECSLSCELFSKGMYIVSVETFEGRIVQKRKLIIQ